MINIPERHKIILDRINREGFVKVADMAKEFGISMMTARKDLKCLHDKGLLYLAHGSASLINPYATERHVGEKEKMYTAEKESIAIAASALLEENDGIIVTSGSTALAFVSHMKPPGQLTVITPCMKAAIELCNMENVNVFQLGGMVLKHAQSTVGNYAYALLDDIGCSKLFMGVGGIDVEWGVSTTNIEEAELDRIMMKSVIKTIVLCDSSKFGKKGIGKICKIDEIDTVITDSGISPSIKNTLEKHGVTVIVA